MTQNIDKTAVIDQPNKILEFELAWVVRYTYYSFMLFGYNRILIIEWMEGQATESLGHAKEAGELITHLGGEAFKAYQQLLELVKGRSVLLEEYAQHLITEEEIHQGEVDKMLRSLGDIASVSVS